MITDPPTSTFTPTRDMIVIRACRMTPHAA
jgi:hypothetical protein